MIYAESLGTLEQFLRTVDEEGFAQLWQIFSARTPQEMLAPIHSDGMQRIWQSAHHFSVWSLGECLDFDELQ